MVKETKVSRKAEQVWKFSVMKRLGRRWLGRKKCCREVSSAAFSYLLSLVGLADFLFHFS